jgi:hypothetical protein
MSLRTVSGDLAINCGPFQPFRRGLSETCPAISCATDYARTAQATAKHLEIQSSGGGGGDFAKFN